jgi:LuxR family transcriptional regulator, maltose regulon positive regulatory protein
MAMRPDGRSHFVPGGGAGRAAGGVVSRSVLLGQLGTSARVTVVSAPAGSGKTVLLRSWISGAGLAGRAAWVTAGRDERDPQRFWLSLLAALRATGPGAELVRAVSAAPSLDGWALAEGLLEDLAPLHERIWLVIDDVHELGSAEALRQLELLVMRAPPQLRFVLAARHDMRLGLHRLRLEGELTELRADDLRFTLAEAGELFSAAGVELSGSALAVLHERTEGWAAGLRLAALSLAGHPDPERFAAEFSGSERTVAEYLLAEVLDRQSGRVRQLLLRTSILERVSGELADLLTGDSDAARVLLDLEEANAFVAALDAPRSWFRYHRLFADLLQLELRRTAPGEIAGLHRIAADWLAGHGFAVEAIRHAQVAADWGLATRLLTGHWPSLHLDGQAAAVHELLARFPAGASAEVAELAALFAADELARGSLEAAEQYLGLAERKAAAVPVDWRGRVLLGVVRLLLARQRGNDDAVLEEARRLRAAAEAPEAAQSGLGEDLRALALTSVWLGITEVWTTGFEEAERHLEQGVALARRIGRPYLEFSGLACLAEVAVYGSFSRAAERGRQAVELARRHGWTAEPAAGTAYMVIGAALTWQGRLEEAEPWIQRAERTVRAETEPATRQVVHYVRGMLELVRGRDADALAAFDAIERLASRLDKPNLVTLRARTIQLYVTIRLGDTARAEQALADLSEHHRDRGETRIAAAVVRLAQHDPRTALDALAPVLDGSASALSWAWQAHAFLLEAIARDALGDEVAAGRALERSLDLVEPDGVVWWFLLHPVPGLLERQTRHRTAHAALIGEIRGLLAGTRTVSPRAEPRPPAEPLSDSELRVLRYLPTNLTAPEIARELSISQNTAKTHIRHVYAKLGTHHRAEAVEHARALGLLAPAGRLPARESPRGRSGKSQALCRTVPRWLANLGRPLARAHEPAGGLRQDSRRRDRTNEAIARSPALSGGRLLASNRPVRDQRDGEGFETIASATRSGASRGGKWPTPSSNNRW